MRETKKDLMKKIENLESDLSKTRERLTWNRGWIEMHEKEINSCHSLLTTYGIKEKRDSESEEKLCLLERICLLIIEKK